MAHTHKKMADIDEDYCWTRLTSNLRSTTRKCVHLVSRGHFRSRDKDGGRTIRSAIAENPMLYANFVALCFIVPEFLPIEVLHCGNSVFFYFFASVTLTLTQWPSFSLRTWPVFPGDIPNAQIWSSYFKAFESYRLTETDRQTDRHDQNHIPRRFVGGQIICLCAVPLRYLA